MRKLVLTIITAFALASCAAPRATVAIADYAATSKAGAIKAAENQKERVLFLLEEGYKAKLAEIDERYAANFADATGYSTGEKVGRETHILTLQHLAERDAELQKYKAALADVDADFRSSEIYAWAAIDVANMRDRIDTERQLAAKESLAKAVTIGQEFYTAWQAKEAEAKAEEAKAKREAALNLKEAELAAWQGELEAQTTTEVSEQ